jgi:fucose permease
MGAVATVAVVSTALQAGVGWRVLARGMSVAPVIVCSAFVMMRIPPLVHETQQRTSLRTLLSRRYFYLAIAAMFLAGCTELGMSQWLPAYAETTLGFSKWSSGMALLGFSLFMGTGRMAAGSVGAKIDPLSLLMRCCAAAAVLFLLACVTGWPLLALAACMLMGLAVSPLWPSLLGLASERFPHGGASMFSLLAVAGNLGGIVMPWLVGVLADNWSTRLGIGAVCVCPCLLLLLLSRMRSDAQPVVEFQTDPA